ncbi:Athe_2463 domain-containing protein [Cohnella thailandensis]
MATYNLYGLIVYDKPFGEWGKGEVTNDVCVAGTSYQRWLGYDVSNNPVTNSCFPNDADAGGNLEDRNWITVSGAAQSWSAMSNAQVNQLLYSTLSGNGVSSPTFTVANKGGKDYAKVMAKPTLCAQGSVQMQHRQTNGKVWYATFFVPAFGCDKAVTTTISTDSSEYTIPVGQDSISIPVKVETRAVFSGYFNAPEYIDKMVAQFSNNGAGTTTNQLASSTVNSSITIKRSDFNGTTSMTKTLTGKGTLFAFGGYVSSSVEKTITIKLAVENGTPNASCSCNPSTVEFTGQDVTTNVTVNAAITGVSSSSISKWIIYGHDAEGGQQQTITVTPSGDKTKATATFTYTTKASKVTGDTYTAKFEQRAVIVFTNGTRKETSLAICSTVIFKPGSTPPPATGEPEPEPSEPPMPSGPVAVITGPTKVKVGQPLPYPIDGSQSFDWQGKDIVMYTWDHAVAQEGPIYDIKFDTPGTRTIILNVKNSSNVWSEEARHTIEVVPDQPPVTTIAVPPEETRLGNVRVQSNAYSTDGDTISKHTFERKYDAANNGFSDDGWVKVQEGEASAYVFKPDRVGKYLFRETACETYGSCASTDAQPESERTLIVNNLAPTIDVVTSSDQTDTSDRTLLPMSTLYNTGTVASLTNGSIGDKSGWVYNQETLSTKNYKTNLGMFNEQWGVADNYYGEDFVDRTLYASIQNTAQITHLGTIDGYTKIYADEKYIYYLASNGEYAGYPQITLTIYNRKMQQIASQVYPQADSVYYFNVMIKGERLYITAYLRNARNVVTTVVDRNNGAIIKANVLMGIVRDYYNSNEYAHVNSLYADDKGIIGYAVPQTLAEYFIRDKVTEIPGAAGYSRISYDLGSSIGYHTGYYHTHYFLQQYYSQSSNNIYVNTAGSFDTGNTIIFDPNGIELAAFEQPPSGPLAYMLVGVDDNRNYYSISRPSYYVGGPKITIHNSAGKLLKIWDYPAELEETSTYKVYYGGNSYDQVYKTERTDAIYTVDKIGNIWTSQPTVDGVYAIALTPNGEYKKLLKLNSPNASSYYNDKGQRTFKILVGSDGLVTFFHYWGEGDAWWGNYTDGNLQVVVFDPKTYTVVSNQTFSGVFLSGTSGSGAAAWWITDRNGVGHAIFPYTVVPIGDQEYLIYAQFSNTNYYYYTANVYKLSATGGLTYPKAYDIGTPSSDLWLGSKINEGHSLEGNLKPTNASAAGAGYLYLAQDKDNYYSAEFEDGQLKVKKTVGGATSIVFSKAYPIVSGQTYTLKFVPEGTGFALYVNRLKQATIPDTGWTSGKYGVISRGQPGVSFFNVSTQPVSTASIGKIYGVVLVNEPLTYDVTFDDPEEDKRITAGEAWIYSHNPNVFLNSLGTWSGAGKSYSTPVTSFSLPGEYPFRFKTRDDPNPDHLYPDMAFNSYRQDSNEVNGTIRVHRRPIPTFAGNADSSGKVTVTDYSYDPDRYNPSTGAYSTEATGLDYQSTRGIFTKRWRMLVPNSTAYQYIDKPPTKVIMSGHYVLELQVQDEYGAWGEEWARWEFDVEAATQVQPPKAGFTTNPILTYRGVPVTIDSTASDPQDGDRTMLPHQYFIKAALSGESLASTSRTTWTKTFNSVGQFTIRQVVTNSYGLTDEAAGSLTIVNRKPAASVTVPASTDSTNPTVFETARPTFQWTYSDADADLQTKYQVRIYKYGGYSYMNSGEISSSSKIWIPSGDIAEEVNFYVTVRVFDGYDWSEWSSPKYFVIITNKPPTGDFSWSPIPAYEGDTVYLSSLVSDPDDDALDVSYKITSPTGSVRTYSYVLNSPYPTTGPSQKFSEVGSWTVTMTVSDRKAPAVTATHAIAVLPLGITGYVRHTEEWEANRLAYNEKNPTSPRPADWFWAGEAFVLDAVTTDTGSSATKPVEVTAAASETLRMSLKPLNPASPVNWTGLLGSEEAGRPLSELEEGLYTFVFTVRYSNGTVKTAAATIRIVDQVGNYVQVHRLT